MHELVRTNDLVLLGAIEALLASASLDCLIADQHISALEGMIGAFPRRLLVRDADRARARALLTEAGFGAELRAMPEHEAQGGLGEIGEDRLLDGRLVLRQPCKGHRAGSDAILLAAALPALGAGPLLDMGSGVGTVGLAAALAQPGLKVVLVERDPELVALAGANIALNHLEERVCVLAADVAAAPADLEALGLLPQHFACVAMNPPYYPAGSVRPSDTPNRRAAHVEEDGLAVWLRTARRLLRPGGHVAIIHRAEALGEVLAGLARGFGDVAIRPIHARADRPAIRIVVTAVLNSRKPAALLPAFVIQGDDGRFTPESEAVHRGRARLG